MNNIVSFFRRKFNLYSFIAMNIHRIFDIERDRLCDVETWEQTQWVSLILFVFGKKIFFWFNHFVMSNRIKFLPRPVRRSNRSSNEILATAVLHKLNAEHRTRCLLLEIRANECLSHFKSNQRFVQHNHGTSTKEQINQIWNYHGINAKLFLVLFFYHLFICKRHIGSCLAQ